MQEIRVSPLYNIVYDNSIFLNKGMQTVVHLAKLVKYAKPRLSFPFNLFERIFVPHVNEIVSEELVIIKVKRKCSIKFMFNKVENEAKCLSILRNTPNIIEMKELRISSQYICLEYCSGGNLYDYLTEVRDRHLNENEVKLILKQIARAINVCHAKGIVHGDIKLENIGLMKENDISELKLLDFGGSHIIKNLSDETLYNIDKFQIAFSPHYMPPELVNRKTPIKEKDLIYIDLWELGVLSYVLLTGNYPFKVKKRRCSYFPVIKKEIKWPSDSFRKISDEMKTFTKNLLKYNYWERFFTFNIGD